MRLNSPVLLYNASSLSPSFGLLTPPPSHQHQHQHSPLCAAGPACGWWWPAGCRWRSRSGRWGWAPWISSSWTSRAASAPAPHRATWCGGSGHSRPVGGGHRADWDLDNWAWVWLWDGLWLGNTQATSWAPLHNQRHWFHKSNANGINLIHTVLSLGRKSDSGKVAELSWTKYY